MKKALCILLSVLCAILLFGCQKAEEPSDGEGSERVFRVGVVQLVQHEALDAATQGFIDALNQQLGETHVKVDVQNASGEPTNCTTIVNAFVSTNVDLIMANATPALQAAASATSDIPILGTSVTDYASALEVDNWNGTVGGNVSGTSDLAPLDSQAAMIKELFPEAKTVGIIFCSSESNSAYQVEVISKELKELGFEVKEFSFTDTNDIASVTQNACESSDVIFIPTDNTAASNTEAIANIVLPAGVPVVSGEEGLARGCGVATLSISYYDLGFATGLQAAKILTGEADVSTMPIEYATEFTKKFNEENCNALNVAVSEEYQPLD
ncbi:MAG: ABC transporter substrate-binding protein [Erysipelotrichaceae bacterium]|nr:ABC transporter substrate-binding protein [Erysipelotrichaceae bacterium]